MDATLGANDENIAINTTTELSCDQLGLVCGNVKFMNTIFFFIIYYVWYGFGQFPSHQSSSSSTHGRKYFAIDT